MGHCQALYSFLHSLSFRFVRSPAMLDICQETTDFVRACEAIHAQMAREPLTSDDRDLIEFSGSELLSKLRPA
jgi:hypothetical protein